MTLFSDAPFTVAGDGARSLSVHVGEGELLVVPVVAAGPAAPAWQVRIDPARGVFDLVQRFDVLEGVDPENGLDVRFEVGPQVHEAATVPVEKLHAETVEYPRLEDLEATSVPARARATEPVERMSGGPSAEVGDLVSGDDLDAVTLEAPAMQGAASDGANVTRIVPTQTQAHSSPVIVLAAGTGQQHWPVPLPRRPELNSGRSWCHRA